MTMDRKHKGARAEMVACVWLLNDGYEVFRNVSQHGLIDVIAIKNGEILKIDVKSSTIDGPCHHRLRREQVLAGVLPLVVGRNGQCRIYPKAKWPGQERAPPPEA